MNSLQSRNPPILPMAPTIPRICDFIFVQLEYSKGNSIFKPFESNLLTQPATYLPTRQPMNERSLRNAAYIQATIGQLSEIKTSLSPPKVIVGNVKLRPPPP